MGTFPLWFPMKNKLEGHYDVLGEIYSVEEVKQPELDGEHALGTCDSEKKEIEIKESESNDSKLETLIHELGHATIDESGLGEDMDAQVEHVIVTAFAKTMIRNFKIEPIKIQSRKSRD